MNLVLYIKDVPNCPKNASGGRKKPQVVLFHTLKTKKSMYSWGKTMKRNLKHFLFVAAFLPMLITRHTRHLCISSCQQSFLPGCLTVSRVSCCFKVKGSGKAKRSWKVDYYIKSVCFPVSFCRSSATWRVFHGGMLQNHSILTSCFKALASSHPRWNWRYFFLRENQVLRPATAIAEYLLFCSGYVYKETSRAGQLETCWAKQWVLRTQWSLGPTKTLIQVPHHSPYIAQLFRLVYMFPQQTEFKATI